MAIVGKRVELELPCTLTESEVSSRSMMLVETVAMKDDTARAKRESNKEFTDKLTALDERQRQLAVVISTGIERRMVACTVLFHMPAEATKRIVRLDTGEVVKEEAMSATECQLHMFDSQVQFEEYMKAQHSEAESEASTEDAPARNPLDPPSDPG